MERGDKTVGAKGLKAKKTSYTAIGQAGPGESVGSKTRPQGLDDLILCNPLQKACVWYSF